jgi:hypothetical protein
MAAADHYGQWRALHVAAPDGWAAEVRRARTAATTPRIDPDPGIEPVTDTSARWLDGRAVLARIRLGDPEVMAIIAEAPGEVARQVPGTLAADVALIGGDAADARDQYLRRLADQPDETRSLIGLGLALEALGKPAPILLQRPELIRVAARELPDVNVLALVDWLGTGYNPC